MIPGVITSLGMIFTKKAPFVVEMNVLSMFNPDTDNGLLGFVKNDILDEILATMILMGSLLVIFTKEKMERHGLDEGLNTLRWKCMFFACLVNSLILQSGVWLTHDFGFLRVMMYNMFTTNLLYILFFYVSMYLKARMNKANGE